MFNNSIYVFVIYKVIIAEQCKDCLIKKNPILSNLCTWWILTFPTIYSDSLSSHVWHWFASALYLTHYCANLAFISAIWRFIASWASFVSPVPFVLAPFLFSSFGKVASIFLMKSLHIAKNGTESFLISSSLASA